MTDYPIEEVIKNMERLIASGHTCWVKFTCVHCGSRQTDAIPNRYCLGGYTCEECGKVTHPTAINFMAVLKINAGPAMSEEIDRILTNPDEE